VKVVPTCIPEVVLVEPVVHEDERGFFMETWQAERFAAAGLPVTFVQDNHSRSVQGVVRGLHYQVTRAQGKLVRVVVGEVYDVAVDLRRSSPTFGRWVSTVLSAENRRSLWIPPGFAHGFYVTSPTAEVVYKCTEPYVTAYDRTIRWNDPDLAISWPLPAGSVPIVSRKDATAGGFASAEVFD
jgi:dTDP-4-dehydrorhamnose 3,5-epimerase